jgi:hypothetical protein
MQFGLGHALEQGIVSGWLRQHRALFLTLPIEGSATWFGADESLGCILLHED